jgi:hypothetical protein
MTFKLQFDPKDIARYAGQYAYAEDTNALDAGARIQRGECTRSNLETIFEWKTKGRGRSRVARNSDGEIADALRLAVSAKTNRAAMAVLIGLHGVDVPVASAILTAIDPKRYTVIDFRALNALGTNTKDRSIDYYLQYLDYCRSLATKYSVDLRTLDRALWQWSKKRDSGLRAVSE